MVTERSSVETDEQPLDADGLPPLEIVDGTSEDNLAKERAFDAGEEVESVVHTDTVGSTETGSEDEPEQGSADVDTQRPAETEIPTPVAEAEEAKEPRIFSEDEVSKMRSTNDRQKAESDRKYLELEQRVQAAETARQEAEQKAQLERDVETQLSQQERALAPTLGDEEAQKVVRDNNNIATVRRSLEAEQENVRLKTQSAQYEQQSARQFIEDKWIPQMGDEHGLSADDVTLLRQQVSPFYASQQDFIANGDAIQALAIRLGADTKASATTAKRDRVPPETQETTLESGHSTATPSNEQAEIDRLMSLPASEWGEAGEKLMREQAGI